MTTPSKSQRGIMAAHLCDLAGIMARGDYDAAALASIITCARWVAYEGHAESNYREGLRSARLDPLEIDEAVSAIERGEDPPGYLPMRLTRLRNVAQAHADGGSCLDLGKAAAFDYVLGMIGGER